MPEIVTSLRRCREVVSELMDETMISVDCEGDQLSSVGKLTLLQISTTDHSVFLFDILADEDMLRDEHGLKMLLESDRLLKVIHSSENESAALYYQFGIELENVFDTQVADLIIHEERDELLFPYKRSLQCINEDYGGKRNSHKSNQDCWGYVSDYWCQRPLTEEMISYSAGDVTALIPEVYENQVKLLYHHRLTSQFNERVKESVRKIFDPDYRKVFKTRTNEQLEKLVHGLRRIRKCQNKFRNSFLVKLLDEDQRRGLMKIFKDTDYGFDVPNWVFNMKNELMYQKLLDMKDEIEDIQSVDIEEYVKPQLKFMIKSDNIRRVRELAREIYNKVSDEWLRRIDKRRMRREPIKLAEMMHVISVHPDYAPSFHEGLLDYVIENVEDEIRKRVQDADDIQMKLGRLAAFHKKFLIKVKKENLQDDMKRLKQALSKAKKNENGD